MDSESNGVRYFPLNVAKLVKGQIITVKELESIFGIEMDDPKWCWKLLNRKAEIERQRAKVGLPVLTMRTPNNTLVVCTDEDAAVYNQSMGKRGIRRFKRATHRNIHVDSAKLTKEQADAHGRNLIRQAMVFSAIQSAAHRALPALTAPERVTPRMIAK